MTTDEMDNMFDVLYNNITSNQAPGLNAYEKSVFLTKAQDEIVKNHFSSKSKGNNIQEGFDDSQKRQIDFSMLTTVATISTFDTSNFDTRTNSKSVTMPPDIMMIINEVATVTRDSQDVILQIVPIRFDEYSRLMSKPYKRPLKYQAWRLINTNTNSNSSVTQIGTQNKADIIIGPSDTLASYSIRYLTVPKPIILSPLDGLSIHGFYGKKANGDYVPITALDYSLATEGIPCELDQILHEEIVQRAVELAKVAWTSTGQDNLNAVLQAGQRSE